MEEGAGRKVGSCFFAAGRRLATDFYDGGTLRPPYFSLIFAATPAHPPRRHAGSARPLATAEAEPPKKAAADGPLADPDGRPRSPRRLPFDPCHQDLHDISLFPCGQLPTGRDRMPLSQTTAAAAGCGMLSDENGVPPHGRLPAVVGNKRRREPPTHEIFGMTADDRHSPAFDTGDLFGPQTEPAAEIGLRQPREKRLERRCLHQILLTVLVHIVSLDGTKITPNDRFRTAAAEFYSCFSAKYPCNVPCRKFAPPPAIRRSSCRSAVGERHLRTQRPSNRSRGTFADKLFSTSSTHEKSGERPSVS